MRIKGNDTRTTACKKRVALGSQDSRSVSGVLQRVRYLSISLRTDYCHCLMILSWSLSSMPFNG